MEILGYSVLTTLPDFPYKHQTIINTLNPHSYFIAKRDVAFFEALQRSDILIPDGSGIVLAARVLRGEKIKRIAGADLHLYLLKKARKHNLRVFYLGSNEATLGRIAARLKQEYPSLHFAVYSPPYKSRFTNDDNCKMQEAVNRFAPDILFVGMTAPKQEKWVQENRHQLQVNTIASIGAVFDFYAGTVRRPGKLWQNLGLEWFPRLLREPRRLWRRSLISAPCFLWDVLKIRLGWVKEPGYPLHFPGFDPR